MSRVLIVSYYFPPFNGPGAQHPDFFHRYLREQGFETATITSAVYYNPNAVEEDAPSEAKGILHLPRQRWLSPLCRRLYKAEMQVQVRMRRWQPGFVWGKLFAVGAAKRLVSQQPAEAMISVSSPVSSHWVALKLKRRFPDLFWIADFTDPFVGNPFASDISERGTQFEREVFSRADVLSANTDTVLTMWQERYPEHANKMMVIRNSWGFATFTPSLCSFFQLFTLRNQAARTRTPAMVRAGDKVSMRRAQFITMICAAATMAGQTQVDLKTQSKTVDFSAAPSTKPIQTGAVLPGACTVGQMFFNTAMNSITGRKPFFRPDFR